MKKIYTNFCLLIITLFLTVISLNGAYAQHVKKDGSPDLRYKENKVSNTNSSSSAAPSRDNHGKIKRSEAAKRDFMKQTGYPNGRQGYVIDHIIPLKKGGCDCPSNMQWQTIQEGKEKDKWE